MHVSDPDRSDSLLKVSLPSHGSYMIRNSNVCVQVLKIWEAQKYFDEFVLKVCCAVVLSFSY